MWKRLQGHVREKDKQVQISNPVLVKTIYDQDPLDRNSVVTQWPKPDQQNHDLPSLDSRSQSEPDPQSNPAPKVPAIPRIQRVSAVSTEPSVYSRASLDFEFYYYSDPTAISRPADDGLPPPSSYAPEKFIPSFDPPSSFPSIPDITLREFSPMDDKQCILPDEPRDPTIAPVLRRAPSVLRTGEVQSGPKQKFWEGKLAPNSKVKWDEYSGEPNSAGKAPSVDPGSYTIGGPSASLRPMGYQVSVTAAVPEKKSLSFGERLTRFGSKRSPTVPASIKQRHAEKSLQISQRTASPSSDQEGSNASTPVLDRTPKPSDTRPVTARTVDSRTHEETIKPIVSFKVEKTLATETRLATPTSHTPHGLGISAFAYPSPLTPKPRDEKQAAVVVIEAEQYIHPAFRTATPPETDKPPIASHFSWSNYTPSTTTDQDSPPPSPPLSASPSILVRRRPVAHSNRIPDSRPNKSKMLASSNTSTYSSVSAMSNTSKALPHPPTALCALDHIALLESQQEDLRIRRNNVCRLLSDLNNAAPLNPLLTDFKTAKAIENKKKVFEVELDEIRREEHEVGLKLHRAWKKREKEDPNSAGSALWIRRVTS